MLDNEPTGGDVNAASTASTDATDSTSTPVRRTRAPRRKAAAAPAVEANLDAVEASAEPAPEVTTAAPVRRRRAKAAAPAVAVDADPAPGQVTPIDQSVAADLVVEAPTPPAKVTRSRRRKVAEVSPAEVPPSPAEAEAEPAADPETPIIAVIPLDENPTELAQEPAVSRGRRIVPPPVLFMAPEAEAAAAAAAQRRTRGAQQEAEPPAGPPARRGRRTAVEQAPAEVPADVAEEPAEQLPAEPARRNRRRRGAAVEEITTETEAPITSAPEAVDEVEEIDNVDDEAEDDDDTAAGRRRRRRGRRGRGRGKGPMDDLAEESDEEEAVVETTADAEEDEEADETDGVTRRRRRRRRKGSGDAEPASVEDGVHTVVRVREPRRTADEVQGVSGSTRLEAKRQRRRDGREQRRTRPPILSESEFLARREAVDRVMVVRQKTDRLQIGVLEDGVLVEHYVSRSTSGTMVGNVYLGKVQNVLPSMEAAFVDIGRGRNAVLYAGEVNWDATGLEGRARSIEQALRSGDSVLVQVTKDPLGHKGARLSSHIALSGRHLVYVPNGNASGISRKLPDNERRRLRDVLKKLVPDGAGVIVRTAAEGASEDELARDVKRLQAQWEEIQRRAADGHAPAALSEEPDLVIRVVRDLFNEDFRELIVQGEQVYGEVEAYLNSVSPDLVDRLHRHTGTADVFAEFRIDEQILKGLDRKVFLPSGGHLVIDRTEAMTVVDVNTGKYTGAGGNLEETVTRNNLEAAEEIVRQLRLRDLGGIVVIDFIDMVLESNRELVLRRLTECLGRDRTKHQVTEITSLGLVQMTRKRIGAGLVEAFSETCDHCKGRGIVVHTEPVPEKRPVGPAPQVKAVAAAVRTEPAPASSTRSRRRRAGAAESTEAVPAQAATATIEPVDEPVLAEPVLAEPVLAEPVRVTHHVEASGPAAEVASVPPQAEPASVGSGIVNPVGKQAVGANEAEYDISGYDLSRYESPAEPMPLAGSDDPDAAEDDDDEPSGARRRSRRGGTRRRTRP